jgi:hypothetical protein
MITITLQRKDLRPHETVAGRVEWRLDKEPRELELRLCWFTRGRGTEEAETIATLPLGDRAEGASDFAFELPGAPWSIEGRLVGIGWGLEVVARKQGGLALEEFVVAPERVPRVLGEITEPRSGGIGPKWLRRFTPKPR